MPSTEKKEYKIQVADLRKLFEVLHKKGYNQFGPVFRDEAIMLEQLNSFDDLAYGYSDQHDKGAYTTEKRDSNGYFSYTTGPQSFKKYLHPPRRKLWSANGSSDEFQISTPELPNKMVFWGIRACDIAAIHTLDEVFLKGSFVNQWYEAARKELILIATTCLKPSSNCFCTTFGDGPNPEEGYDLRLIERHNDNDHFFIAHANTSFMEKWLDKINAPLAEKKDRSRASDEIEVVKKKMPLRFNPDIVAQKLKTKLEDKHWEDVANRCLSCANCTLVCPTCFCTSTEDITAITGDHTERWLNWDSCFVGNFSYVHGGKIRPSTRSRYRQWLTHKLSNWYDQFGSSGCVGCGRCITWCPVGIDITEEALALCNTSEETT